MRFEIAFAAILATIAGAMPHGGHQEHQNVKTEQSPSSSMSSMSSTSMTMPMKRSTPTADATPASSASMRMAKSTDEPIKAKDTTMMMMMF